MSPTAFQIHANGHHASRRHGHSLRPAAISPLPSGGISFTRSQPVTLSATDVTVVALDGQPVPTRQKTGRVTETVHRGSAIYTGAVKFRISAAGSYEVRIQADGGANEVVVARSIGDVVRAAIPWLLLRAVAHSGPGLFSEVTYIQRLETVGGTAPASGCDASTVGAQARIAYQARYVFWKPHNPDR